MYFAQELARRLAGTGITALAIDPGPVASGIADNETGLLAAVGQRVVKRFFPAPEIAARPALALATEPRFGEPAMSGAYFLKSERKQPRLDPRQPDLGARLWALSAELTGVDPAPLG